jgi:hypothetical protein
MKTEYYKKIACVVSHDYKEIKKPSRFEDGMAFV